MCKNMYFCQHMEITTAGSPRRIPCLLHIPEKVFGATQNLRFSIVGFLPIPLTGCCC